MTTPPPAPGPPDHDRTALRRPLAESRSPRPPQRRTSRVPFVMVACALAIILGMGGGVFWVVRHGGGGGLPGGASPSPSPHGADPAAVVRGYLTELSQGHAKAALGYGMTQPADTAFTSDSVLAAAVAQNPITGINVPEVPQDGPTPKATTSIDASYKIGDERVTTSFELTWVTDRYKLDKTTSDWDVSSLRSKRVPLMIAGKKVDSDSVTLLPASYPITTGLTYLSWGANDSILVKKPDAFMSTGDLDITITDAGLKALRTAVQRELTACVKIKNPKPSGCPFDYSTSSYTINNKSVKWSFTQSPMTDFTPTLSYDKDGVAKISLQLHLRFAATGVRTYDKKKTTVDDTVTTYATGTADLTQNTVKVAWSD